MITYLDTSAAMKLLVDEHESAALVTALTDDEVERELVASWLLHTELHCAANRHPDAIDVEALTTVLDTVTLVDLTRGDMLSAGALPGRLRSNDALHLAAALRVGVDEMITYDLELTQASRNAGLIVTQPG